VKLKLRTVLPDLLSTSLLALKESADPFPPLKGVVGGVLALWDIAERVKHSKSDACAVALRAKDILDVIAEAVPDGSTIPEPMLRRIERFTSLLHDIRRLLAEIEHSGLFSRVVRLNLNEHALQGFKAQLDEAYRDFQFASMLRVEMQQAEIAAKQVQLVAQQQLLADGLAQTHMAVAKVAEFTDTLAPQLPRFWIETSWYRLSTSVSTVSFFGQPLNDLMSPSNGFLQLLANNTGRAGGALGLTSRGNVWFSSPRPHWRIGRASPPYDATTAKKPWVRAGIG